MVLVTVMLWLNWCETPGQIDCDRTVAQPRVISVVVPDREAERLVRQELPRVQIVVLQSEPGEPLEVLLDRAWDCRDAECYFFDPERECLPLASLRERLRQQGVVPINLPRHLAISPRMRFVSPGTEAARR